MSDSSQDQVEGVEHLFEVLPAESRQALATIAGVAADMGLKTYLVGGTVRDLLLRRPHYDLDITVEGNAQELAAELAHRGLATVEAAHRFGTAEIKWEGGKHIDLVTARREWYSAPGALPEVEPGNIADDLARRDFTINSMAAPLTPGGADGSEGTGDLLDPHGGLQDLQKKLIRVLHDRSFQDDPTRIPRAVKYAERLGFGIEPHTLELIFLAVRDAALSTVSPQRIMREILLITREPKAASMLSMLRDFGVLAAIHPYLAWPYSTISRVPPSPDTHMEPQERSDTILALLGAEYASEPEVAEALARSLALDARTTRILRDSARLVSLRGALSAPHLEASQVADMLRKLDEHALRAYARIEAMSADEPAWSRLQNYLSTWSSLRTELNGHDLEALGIPKGPAYGEILDKLKEEKLDGKLAERGDELRFVQEWIAANMPELRGQSDTGGETIR